MVDSQNAAIELGCGGGAGQDRPRQVPGAAVDDQVAEVDVVGVCHGAQAGCAGAATDGILQRQGVAAAGAAIDHAGGRELHCRVLHRYGRRRAGSFRHP
ncbi:hypothetical protein G6F65_021758 [Rhizopus arrhizus]|nr:hypothetical protein G6F65_021758 [Rhizopus arrhizus]